MTDDQIENSAKGKSKKRDLVTLLVDARPENARTVPANAKEKPGYLTLAVGPGANGGKPVTFDADTLPEGVRMDARADAAAPGYTRDVCGPGKLPEHDAGQTVGITAGQHRRRGLRLPQ